MNLITYCSKCVYPSSTVNLGLENGVCSSCKTFEKFNQMTNEDWENRKVLFKILVDEIKKKNNSNYDCVIGVSGGKDSYYQTHIAIEYGLKPLLVTYDGNNYLPEGIYNRDRMKKIFNADHIIFGPSEEVLIKLNRMGLRKMGDMNWQNHCGIMTVPIKAAVMYKVPIVIWGEIPWDISGMYDPSDFAEFSARARLEHAMRGFEEKDFLNDEENLKKKDLIWTRYPSDEEILKIGVRGIYLGNYFKWDPNQHVKLMKEKYGWIESKKSFQRTYRKASNLDDKYENGAHDLLKFIKFGYGRASDHASKDIRDGYITREQGVKYVKNLDHIISDDLLEWLEYVKMSEEEFWEISDSFRSHKVWWIENGKWFKNNIWGDNSSYGEVKLSKIKIDEFNQKQEKFIKNKNV